MEQERPELDRAHGEIENRRPIWIMELLAECVGVFAYVYCGIGATASFYISQAEVPPVVGFGSILNIGLCYGFGIVFGLIIVAPTSGGHLSPSYTLAFMLFKGFPIRKAAGYILAQILGAYLAALLVYTQYSQQLDLIFRTLNGIPATRSIIFTNHGPPGVLALFTAPGQYLGLVFLNEFVSCTLLALLVFAVLDNSNIFISFNNAPFIIGLGYALIIIAFGFNSVALNSARDLGVTNIPATILGAAIQTFLFSDSARPIVNLPPITNAEPKAAPCIRDLANDKNLDSDDDVMIEHST